ncbi:MAG: hypothetical protein UT05_C0002G0011 [Parcubacteria group bacterium GW2011_GWF2_38_76]|nr:MAG: hypothetical protein UT05_C0002G0011 [Parcubacteria group bacterium GW2011_GWF2_38_76]HBM45834.1 hypothetical protein [Patescibacteria group bacterium]
MNFENPTSPKQEVSKEIKKRVNDFEPHKELVGNESIGEIADWFQNEVEEYVEDHSDYMMGGNFEELVGDMVEYLADKKDIKLKREDIIVSTKDKYDEETTSGSLYLSGEQILKYVTGTDGYGPFVEDWNEAILKKELGVLLEKKS